MTSLALLNSSAEASALISSAHVAGRTVRKSGIVGAGGNYIIGLDTGCGTVRTGSSCGTVGAGRYTGCRGGAIVVAALAGAVE